MLKLNSFAELLSLNIPLDINTCVYIPQLGTYITVSDVDNSDIITDNNKFKVCVENFTVNVKQFGVVGDGVFDDTDRLKQAAISLAEGYTLLFPNGNYSIRDTINFQNSNIKLQGSGCTITQHTNNKKSFNFIQSNNIEIYGFTFIGRGLELVGTSTSFNNVSALFFNSCFNINVYNNKIINHVGGGIRWTGYSYNISIHDNIIAGIGSTGGISPGDNGNDIAIGSYLSIDSSNIHIYRNNISKHCFGIFLNEAQDIYIKDNLIHSISGQHAIYLSNTYNFIISNNIFKDIMYSAVKDQISTNGTILSNIIISNNIFSNIGRTAIDFNVLPNNPDSRYKNVIIESNSIADINEYGVHLAQTEDCIVSDNIFNNIICYGIFGRGFSGVIKSNTIKNCGWNGIHLQLIDTTEICCNTITDTIQNYKNQTIDYRLNNIIYVSKSLVSINVTDRIIIKDNVFNNKSPIPLYLEAVICFGSGTTLDYFRNFNLTGKNITNNGGQVGIIEL